MVYRGRLPGAATGGGYRGRLPGAATGAAVGLRVTAHTLHKGGIDKST